MKLLHRLNLLLVVLPFGLLVIVFAVLNRTNVEVDLFVALATMPLYVVVLGALAAGFLLGVGIFGVRASQWRMRARAGERRARVLEGEVAGMKRSAETEGQDQAIIAASRAGRRPRWRALLGDR